MTHAELQEMLELYVLGALARDDCVALGAHLRACTTCLETLADLEECAAELARAVEPRAPSRHVTRRILAATRSESRHPPPNRSVQALCTPRRHAPRRHWRLVRVAASIAAVLVGGVLIVEQIHLMRRLDRASTMLARGRDLMEFMASPDVVTIGLAATKSVPDARGLVAYDRRSGRTVLLAFDLPSPARDQVYQLWLISEGVRPSGVFSPDARGDTLLQVHRSPVGREVPVFAVTLEPSPGMPDPTGPILLLGRVSGIVAQ